MSPCASFTSSSSPSRSPPSSAVTPSRELVELSLQRIEATQSTLNAFRVVRQEQALREAELADERLAAGETAPLLGVPVAIKDDVDLAGHTTPFGCGGEHPTAAEDAELVRRLRAAGVIVIGKTNAREVGQWLFTELPDFGATRNPGSLDHTPGGSSGGPVAAGLVAGDRHQPPAPNASFAALAAEPPPRLRIALSFATPLRRPRQGRPGDPRRRRAHGREPGRARP